LPLLWAKQNSPPAFPENYHQLAQSTEKTIFLKNKNSEMAVRAIRVTAFVILWISSIRLATCRYSPWIVGIGSLSVVDICYDYTSSGKMYMASPLVVRSVSLAAQTPVVIAGGAGTYVDASGTNAGFASISTFAPIILKFNPAIQKREVHLGFLVGDGSAGSGACTFRFVSLVPAVASVRRVSGTQAITCTGDGTFVGGPAAPSSTIRMGPLQNLRELDSYQNYIVIQYSCIMMTYSDEGSFASATWGSRLVRYVGVCGTELNQADGNGDVAHIPNPRGVGVYRDSQGKANNVFIISEDGLLYKISPADTSLAPVSEKSICPLRHCSLKASRTLAPPDM
jgi:hypothetical protein